MKGVFDNEAESNSSLSEFQTDKLNSLYQVLNSQDNMSKGYIIPEIKLDLIEIGKYQSLFGTLSKNEMTIFERFDQTKMETIRTNIFELFKVYDAMPY